MAAGGCRILLRDVARDQDGEILMLWYIRRVLYKEPFDGPLPWMNLGVGCFAVFAGLFGVFLKGPGFLIGPTLLTMGLMFVCQGVADLLPPERRSATLTLGAGFLVFQSATVVLAVGTLLQQGLGA